MIQIDQNKTTTPTTITMKAISAVSKAQVISLLSSGSSVRKIASKTSLSLGTISNIRSQHCPDLKKTVGGHPSKLSLGDICHAIYLLGSQKAETAVQVARDLRNITNQPLSVHTIRRCLRQAGLKSVVKKKRPLLSARHRRNRMDFALSHQHWTIEDWKRVIFSDETKINRLRSDGRKWA